MYGKMCIDRLVMKEKPSFVKTKEVLVSDYFYQLTPKEKKDIETMLIQLGYLNQPTTKQ